MKLLFIFLLFIVAGIASVIAPSLTLKTDGLISDMVVREGKIYASTDSGIVNIFDSVSKRKQSSITAPNVSILG